MQNISLMFTQNQREVSYSEEYFATADEDVEHF